MAITFIDCAFFGSKLFSNNSAHNQTESLDIYMKRSRVQTTQHSGSIQMPLLLLPLHIEMVELLTVKPNKWCLHLDKKKTNNNSYDAKQTNK